MIKTIIDAVVGGAQKAIDAAKTVAGFLSDPTGSEIDNVGGPTRGSILGRRQRRLARRLLNPERPPRAGAPQVQTNNASVTVSFENAPPGTRTEIDPSSDGDVDLSTGFAMGTP